MRNYTCYYIKGIAEQGLVTDTLKTNAQEINQIKKMNKQIASCSYKRSYIPYGVWDRGGDSDRNSR